MSHAFEEALTQYDLYAQAAGYSRAQMRMTRWVAGMFDRFLGGAADVERVTRDDYRRFLAHLRSRPAMSGHGRERTHGLSGTTLNTYARNLKAFFSWLTEEGIIAENPIAQTRAPRKPKTIPKVYSEEELIAVTKTVDGLRDRAIYLLFLDSGLRLQELSKLDLRDIDTRKGSARVKGKGGKERFVYFTEPAIRSLDAYLNESRHGASVADALFVSPEGTRLTPSGIQSMLCRLGEKAGIRERLAPHKLRHTFATMSLKYGGNLEYLKKMLGHVEVQTTSESYLNVDDDDVRAAHRHSSPVSNLLGNGARNKSHPPPDGNRPRSEDLREMRASELAYQETDHELQIRQTALELMAGLSLPLTKDSFIPELRPGRVHLGKEEFAVEITKKGEVRLGLASAGAPDPDLFQNTLRVHLETAGLSSIFTDIGIWSKAASAYLMKCHRLLKTVQDAVEKTFGTSAPSASTPGFTLDFLILISASAIESASGSTYFDGFRYTPLGLDLRFGGYVIYNGSPDEDLKRIEDAHVALRTDCTTWPQTREIAKARRDLDTDAVGISHRLQKFVSHKRLPGHCELCS